ncbi:hypothetical protein JM48_1461 [Lactiplantibacillus plantarum]|nr:hypothetical protein JM48_1461 [Lactiplantibacillus plantarum]
MHHVDSAMSVLSLQKNNYDTILMMWVGPLVNHQFGSLAKS